MRTSKDEEECEALASPSPKSHSKRSRKREDEEEEMGGFSSGSEQFPYTNENLFALRVRETTTPASPGPSSDREP